MSNICFSGGADGADTSFGIHAKAAGHEVQHFAFKGMAMKPIPAKYRVDVLPDDLHQADEHLTKANEILKRSFPCASEYASNLLRRNYQQIKNTKSVYAVAPIENNLVQGGTGWAIQMAIDLHVKHIFVFDLNKNKWVFWYQGWMSYPDDKMSPPKPKDKYTGIGSRSITKEGSYAIKQLYV